LRVNSRGAAKAEEGEGPMMILVVLVVLMVISGIGLILFRAYATPLVEFSEMTEDDIELSSAAGRPRSK
jgi:hypothetical protein